jgi:serine/threonine protein phosphatase 1
MRDHFIIGDVHGCFYTLKALLKNWKPTEQQLILVGDITDHGINIPQTATYLQEIIKKHPDTVIVRGNHEELLSSHYLVKANESWYEKSGERNYKQYLSFSRNIIKDATWFSTFPLLFKTPHLLVTHAGVTDIENPFDPNHKDGVLWNRKEIKRLDQLQVFGHTPQDNAVFNQKSNSINIDTGAFKNNKLTAIVVKKDGIIHDLVTEKTADEDLKNAN